MVEGEKVRRSCGWVSECAGTWFPHIVNDLSAPYEFTLLWFFFCVTGRSDFYVEIFLITGCYYKYSLIYYKSTF